MDGFTLRMAEKADTADICRVWRLSFGDEAETVSSLLLDIGLLETAVVAEMEGRVRSVMLSFDGLRFGEVRAAYLYALCTDPACRGQGMGEAVVRQSAFAAFRRGAALACLHPASASLAAWYERIMGMRALPAPDYMPNSAAEMPQSLLRANALFDCTTARNEPGVPHLLGFWREGEHRALPAGAWLPFLLD